MKYEKLSGSGNTFVIINNLSCKKLKEGELATNLCSKEKTDGILFIEPSLDCDFKMRMFNPDGSSAKMCGNGARCAAFFAYKEGIAKEEMTIETFAGNLKAYVSSTLVKVMVPKIEDVRLNLPLTPLAHFVMVGVPHTIIITEDVEKVDVVGIGRRIRNDKMFKQGTNVDFVEVLSKDTFKIRTYERGVENETLSCGTGTCASAHILYLLKKTHFPTTAITRSKEKLIVSFEDSRLYLEGEVSEIV